MAPLIIAHELGHNFGAPHDAEPGSVCASAPEGWLMSPFVNYSNQFSACSIQQMQAAVAAAACIRTAQIADVAVSVDPQALDLLHNRESDVPVTVTSAGNVTAENVTLSMYMPYNVAPLSVTGTETDCTISGSSLHSTSVSSASIVWL